MLNKSFQLTELFSVNNLHSEWQIELSIIEHFVNLNELLVFSQMLSSCLSLEKFVKSIVHLRL